MSDRIFARSRSLLAGLAGALMLMAAGCTSTTSAPVEVRDARAAPTPVDPERQAAVRLELAAAYFERGQVDTALEEVRRALAARPDLSAAHDLRGLIYASVGENDRAEESFRRALQLAPREGATMHNYGWFLCQQRRFADADAQFAAALAQPQYRDVPRTLLAQGVCQARGGRWPEAERSLTRAFEIDSGNPAAAFSLSEVLLQRGELDRARFYVGRLNAVDAFVTSQSLWLAIRIERRLGNLAAMQELGRRLVDRFPDSTESLRYQRGRFEDE